MTFWHKLFVNPFSLRHFADFTIYVMYTIKNAIVEIIKYQPQTSKSGKRYVALSSIPKKRIVIEISKNFS